MPLLSHNRRVLCSVLRLQPCGKDDNELFYVPPPPRPPADESDDDSLSIAAAEDSPETRPETLEPLPLTADPNYPQEDARTYFAKISNVRTDKFSLGKRMLDGSKVKIPSCFVCSVVEMQVVHILSRTYILVI
jgi:hypothetical protein